eukprot:gene5081-biopygen8301
METPVGTTSTLVPAHRSNTVVPANRSNTLIHFEHKVHNRRSDDGGRGPAPAPRDQHAVHHDDDERPPRLLAEVREVVPQQPCREGAEQAPHANPSAEVRLCLCIPQPTKSITAGSGGSRLHIKPANDAWAALTVPSSADRRDAWAAFLSDSRAGDDAWAALLSVPPPAGHDAAPSSALRNGHDAWVSLFPFGFSG